MHWAIVAGDGPAYNSELGQQVWGTLGMLRTMTTAVHSETDFAVPALAFLSARCGLQVGEVGSIRRSDVKQPRWINLYDCKTKRRWMPAKLGTYAQRWRQAPLACRVLQRMAQ